MFQNNHGRCRKLTEGLRGVHKRLCLYSFYKNSLSDHYTLLCILLFYANILPINSIFMESKKILTSPCSRFKKYYLSKKEYLNFIQESFLK